MVFGGVGKFESERKDLQVTQKRKEKKRIGGEGKGKDKFPFLFLFLFLTLISFFDMSCSDIWS